MEINKPVVIYGTGMEGERFYCRHKADYEIAFCIDENKDKKFHGMSVYPLKEVIDRLKDYFVVVAVDYAEYGKIRNILQGGYLTEYKDFAYAWDVGKKIAILYGNCHMGVLEQYLINNPYFYSEYKIIRKEVMLISMNVPTDNELSVCDLFICQDIRKENELGVPSADELIQKLPVSSKSIKIINLHGFNLFFPQMNRKLNISNICKGRERYVYQHLSSEGVGVLKESAEYIKMMQAVKMICALDYRIEYLTHNGFSVDEIVDEIMYGEPYSKEDILDSFYTELDRIRERERECDITISDFIESNYRDFQLFYDPNHPTEKVIAEKGRRILKLLNMECYDMNPLPQMLHLREVFVYGCVKRCLGLKYEKEFIRYGCRESVLSNKAIDLPTFVNDYITWFNCDGDEIFCNQYDNIVGYGVGQYYEKVKADLFRKVKFHYLCDVKFKNQKGKYDKIDIISVDDIRDLRNVLVIIMTGNEQNYLSIRNICESLGVDYVHADVILD